jgi:hypothetical protein
VGCGVAISGVWCSSVECGVDKWGLALLLMGYGVAQWDAA